MCPNLQIKNHLLDKFISFFIENFIVVCKIYLKIKQRLISDESV